MQSRSLARELALLVLGQLSDRDPLDTADLPLESMLQKGLDKLI